MSSKTLVICLLGSLLKMPAALSVGFKQTDRQTDKQRIVSCFLFGRWENGDTNFGSTNSYGDPTLVTRLVLVTSLQMLSHACGVGIKALAHEPLENAIQPTAGTQSVES